MKGKLGLSHREVSATLGKLIGKGLVRYRPGKRGGKGKARNIHFLTPYGSEAYRAKRGQYPDRGGRSPKHADLVARVIRALGVERLPHRRFDIHDDAGAKRGVEVESGSNNGKQLDENLAKSLEFQGEAWFVGADECVVNRVIQAAARHCFDHRIPVILNVAAIGALPEWDSFHFEAVPVTA